MARILSIDVGGTRIKAAVIETPLTLNKLQNTKVTAIRNYGWLNEHLPEIVDPDLWASFTNHIFGSDTFDTIAIDGYWSVSNNQIQGHYPDEFNIPHDLSDQLEKYFHMKKKIICSQNDAIAWLKGMIQYLTLTDTEVHYPVLSLVFGTGIGSAYAKTSKDLTGIDVGKLSDYHHLNKFEEFQNNWEVHSRFSDRKSNSFFRKLRDDRERRSWSYDKVRHEYTLRAEALVRDVINEKKLTPQSLLIGGGFSEYISQRTTEERLSIKTKVFRSLDFKINPDLVPLIGNIVEFK